MYHMTVYDQSGETLHNETIQAKTDDEAKKIGFDWLAEKGYESKPHRIFHTTGRLVSFYPHQFKLMK